MSKNYYYIVLAIPDSPVPNPNSGKSDQYWYGTCHYDLGTCYDQAYCFNNYQSGCQCVPIVYQIPAQPGIDWGGEAGCNSTVSVYRYMGGDSKNLFSQNNLHLIPQIGGHYPNEITGTVPNMPSYADIVYGGTQLSQGAAPQGYIVLAYDPFWVQSFTDLELLGPNNPNIVNTGGAKFYFNSTNNKALTPIPNIEDQLYLLLSNFCSQTSTQCFNGESSCSNFFSSIPGPAGSNNYCYQAYQGYLSNREYYPGTNNAVDTAMTAYCGQFKDNPPLECQCLNRDQISLFGKISHGLGKNNKPGCWWYPCKDNQHRLIDYPTWQQAEGHCPDVCIQIFKVMKGAHINSQNSSVNQYMTCCQGKAGIEGESGSSCCQDPSQPQCTSTTPTGSSTFWQKYGLWIIGLIIFILVLSILIGIIIYSRRK